ncbi:MAG: hypothetical protein ABIN25_01910 [Ginsengibacter sp.]
MQTENATMQTAQSNGETLNISHEKLISLVNHLYGGDSGNPNPDEPLKPGPWDPIIRKVSRQVFGPSPEPWRTADGPYSQPSHSDFRMDRLILKIIAERHPEIYEVIGGGRFDWVALNPQPLPPKAAFVVAFTEEVLDRVMLMQAIADAINQTGEQQGIIIVGGKIASLVDELCGNYFKIKIPIPHPKHDSDKGLSGVELILAASVFEKSSATVDNGYLQQELQGAAKKLIEVGISRV